MTNFTLFHVGLRMSVDAPLHCYFTDIYRRARSADVTGISSRRGLAVERSSNDGCSKICQRCGAACNLGAPRASCPCAVRESPAPLWISAAQNGHFVWPGLAPCGFSHVATAKLRVLTDASRSGLRSTYSLLACHFFTSSIDSHPVITMRLGASPTKPVTWSLRTMKRPPWSLMVLSTLGFAE